MITKKELLEKANRVEAFIQGCPSYEDKEQLLMYMSAIKENIGSREYGLVFEEHREEVEDILASGKPILVEEPNMAIDNGGVSNSLIEGDNLVSLEILRENYTGKVDVIYTDPPYNTGGGKDFAYKDKFDSTGDVFKHSHWLSFIHKRLLIAKDLLSDNGVFFISIGDEEQAGLRLLCDQIFGEDCHVATIHCHLSTTQGLKVRAAQKGCIVKNAEYILCYTKDGHKEVATEHILYDLRPEYDDHCTLFVKPDGEVVLLRKVYDYRFPKDCSNEKPLSLKEAFRRSDDFRLFIKNNLESVVRGYERVPHNIPDNLHWVVNHVTKAEINGKDYWFMMTAKGEKSQLLRLSKSWGKTDGFYQEEGIRKVRGDWWDEFYLDMGNVSKEGSVSFPNGKKPIRLIYQLLKMCAEKNALILDFFAGSGTTGHAVMQLNKEDGGERRFILCTNNENNICREKTHVRIKNAIEDNKYEASLRFFRAEFPSLQNTLDKKK